jgi:hypothetical protein
VPVILSHQVPFVAIQLVGSSRPDGQTIVMEFDLSLARPSRKPRVNQVKDGAEGGRNGCGSAPAQAGDSVA